MAGRPFKKKKIMIIVHCPFADLDTCELSEEMMLDTVTRFYLAALLKHGNLLPVAEVESDV